MGIHLAERVTDANPPEGVSLSPWIVTACHADGRVTIERELLDGSLGVKQTREAESLRAWTDADALAYFDRVEAGLTEQRALILRMVDAADELGQNLALARAQYEVYAQ